MVRESPPLPLRPNCVGPISPRPSPRWGAYIQHLDGIPYLIRPPRGGRFGGETFFQFGGRLQLVQRARHPRFTLQVGHLVPPQPGGLLGKALVRHCLLIGVEVPRLSILGAPLAHWGADLKHTCDCPRCMVQYETSTPSLMAQVRDLQTHNQELQRSHQEPCQAVAAVTGISQSYRDRTTQSTLAKKDEVVQGYQGESKVVAASLADHLKMSNSNTTKCFGVVEMLAKHSATISSRLDEWDRWYANPTKTNYSCPAPAMEGAARS